MPQGRKRSSRPAPSSPRPPRRWSASSTAGWGMNARRRSDDTHPMSRDEIIAKIRQTAPALRAEGVSKLAIFGSRSRGDAGPDSDLDVLVEVDPAAPFSLLNLSGVALIVEAATGLQAQVTLKRSLNERMAERIADDVVEV